MVYSLSPGSLVVVVDVVVVAVVVSEVVFPLASVHSVEVVVVCVVVSFFPYILKKSLFLVLPH